ncbi:ExeM/NucH family extracellular endonuclease [Rhizobacter sp. LjRoot28]|uniref:ExeM/NucH family extracellular endonuclease n=1 Tax=Rhizobacter sp. LjRoot28 TaxID=3342309 RepID=UPI003ECCE1F5
MKLNALAACVAATLAAPCTWASPQGVVISQVYGGGGNSGATLRSDFIELFNGGAAPVSLAGWSVQYASAAGSSWQVTPLGEATLAPGQYFLVKQADGAGGSVALPAADASGAIAMSATAGKVALVASTAPLTGTAPSGAALVDLVGFGATASAYEGAAAPASSNTLALVRTGGGCTDTDQNSSDFTAAAPAPRNAAAAAAPCGGLPGNAPIVPRCDAATVAVGVGGTVIARATDADSIVTGGGLAAAAPGGIALAGTTPATVDGGTATLSLTVTAAAVPGSYSVPLQWWNNEGQTASCTLVVQVGGGVVSIPAIQGRGATSPRAGETLTTQGVVTRLVNNGFFLQDPVGDGDPLTSDGILVYTGAAPTVSVGQTVRLTGTVTEFNTGAAGNADTAARPVTELTRISGLTTLGSGASVAPVTVALPEAVDGDLERYEGMLVHIPGPLTVSQNYFLGRYGQLTLSAGGRLLTPTNVARPGAAAQAVAEGNARRRIVLDDGSSAQNPNPMPYLGADDTVRGGDTLDGVTGVVDYGLATSSNTGFGDYKVHPTVAPVIRRTHPRPVAPPEVGGNVKVASANVLNYFTTLNDGSNVCAPGNTADDCRGANSAEEFNRQRRKIVEALAALDADVVGLMEIQNNGAAAVDNLVAALNARMGAGRYAAVPDPAGGTGTDAIKVAMIYKPARLTRPVPSAADTTPVHNRPPLAQTFAAANGERFTVIVNHFKSKGCTGASGADADSGDLQGCFNARRLQQAQALRSFAAAQRTAGGTDHVLLIGDLNAYAQEDPVHNLLSGGFVDVIGRSDPAAYSYVFDGAAGRLDHALASAALAPKVTGAAEWHINADEPSVIDYNLEFKPRDLYQPNAFRSSDHDPVLIGLHLLKGVAGSPGRDALSGTPGDDVITGGEGADLLTGGAGRDVFVYRSLRDAGDTVTDFLPGTDRLEVSALLASLGLAGRDAVADGVLRFVASATGTAVMLDVDGHAGPASPRLLLALRDVTPTQLRAGRDY